MKKKLFAILLAVIMLSAVGTSMVFAENEGGRTYTVETGDVVAVPITLENCNRLMIFLMTGVTYDSNLLTLQFMGGKKGLPPLTVQGEGFGMTMPAGQLLNSGDTVGYIVFTAKEGLTEDVSTQVKFPAASMAINDSYQSIQPEFLTIDVDIKAGAAVEEPVLYGDVNEDGIVDLADVILLMQHISGNVTLTSQQFKAADVNKDGVVNTGDVIFIMQMCLG